MKKKEKTLPLFEGLERKKAGIKRVIKNSDGWHDIAVISVEQIRMRQYCCGEFNVNHIKNWLIPMIGQPHHKNCWGALQYTCKRLRIFEDTGTWEPSTARKANHRKIPRYRWVA